MERETSHNLQEAGLSCTQSHKLPGRGKPLRRARVQSDGNTSQKEPTASDFQLGAVDFVLPTRARAELRESVPSEDSSRKMRQDGNTLWRIC